MKHLLPDHLSIAEIEHAVKVAAKIVALYGERYLPTFQRLHSELLKSIEKENQKDLALKIAIGYTQIE